MKSLLIKNENKFKLCLLSPYPLRIKQTEFEKITQIVLDYTNLSEQEKFEVLHSRLMMELNSINWDSFDGKTHFKKLFNLIDKKLFLDKILIKFILTSVFKTIESRSYLKDLLQVLVVDFLTINNIVFDYIELTYICAYLIEVLHKQGYFILQTNSKYYSLPKLKEILKSIGITVEDLVYLVNFNWPLIIPGNKYSFIKNEYKGGYYYNLLPLTCGDTVKFKITNPIKPMNYGLIVIHKLQNIPYYLIQNIKIINIIQLYYLYLSKKIDNILCNGSKNLNDYLENWLACFQYLTFFESNILIIYFPFQLDFRGRIYSGVNFGLNPTSNKLSRIILGPGKFNLDLNSRLTYENSILIHLNKDLKSNYIDLNSFNFDTFIVSIYHNIEKVLEIYSINTIIYLCDWFYNVLVDNTSECFIELDATQSGFQMLSLLSNDYKGMLNTNLISVDNFVNIDLYTSFLNLLKIKILNNNWILFLNRNFIKKVIMTIPYGSTIRGQIKMLEDEFKTIYFIGSKLDISKIQTLLDLNILVSTKIYTLEKVKIRNKYLKEINNCEKIITKQKDLIIKNINEKNMDINKKLLDIQIKTEKYLLKLKDKIQKIDLDPLTYEEQILSVFNGKTLIESLNYLLILYNDKNKVIDETINICLVSLSSEVIFDLRENMFKEIVIELKKLVEKEYPKIYLFCKFIKNNLISQLDNSIEKKIINNDDNSEFSSEDDIEKIDLTFKFKINKELDINILKEQYCIKTKYFKFYYFYNQLIKKSVSIVNTKYIIYIINENMLDFRKLKQGIIANMCHGFGDAFIMQDIIYNNLNIMYPIHDAILCKVTELDDIKDQITKSYNFVYNYMQDYPEFKEFYLNFIEKRYTINSKNIFKIK
jgi:hypothetical protein